MKRFLILLFTLLCLSSSCFAGEVLDPNIWTPLTTDKSIYMDTNGVKFTDSEMSYGKYGHNLAMYWMCYVDDESDGKKYNFIHEVADFDSMEGAYTFVIIKDENGDVLASEKVYPVVFEPWLPGSVGEHIAEYLLQIKQSRLR